MAYSGVGLTLAQLNSSTALASLFSQLTGEAMADTLIDVAATLVEVQNKLTEIDITLDAQLANDTATVTELPPLPLQKTKRLTRALVTSSTATTTSIVTATASQTTRLHRAIITIEGATTFELVDGAGTNLRTIKCTAAKDIILDLTDEPWVVTPANSALQMKSSAAVNITFDGEYVKSA